MVCPACLNSDDNEFVELDSHITYKSEADYGPDIINNISLYACRKCSNVMVDDWHFKQKDDSNKKEEEFEHELYR